MQGEQRNQREGLVQNKQWTHLLFCVGLVPVKLLCSQQKPESTLEAKTPAERYMGPPRARKHVLDPYLVRKLGNRLGQSL